MLKDYKDLKVMMTSSDLDGCSLARIVRPGFYLKPQFDWFHIAEGFPMNDPRTFEADVIWLQRANHEYFSTFIPDMRAQGKKFVYDIDDNLYAIPASNLAHRYYGPKELKKVAGVIKECDCITTSTLPLKEFLENKFQKPTFVIPNFINYKQVEMPNNGDIVKIGWAGSYTHNGDFDLPLVNTLRKIKEIYKDKVQIDTFGFQPQFFKGLTNYVPWSHPSAYMETLENLKWDIGFIVAEDNEFNRCKSNIKFLEYSMVNCVSITHNTYPYFNTVRDGENALLVHNKKTDWMKHFTTLIENPELRKQMATIANQFVKDNFTYEFAEDKFLESYKQVYDFLYKGN